MVSIRPLFLLTLFGGLAWSQPTPKEFDVATIKPSAPDARGINFGFSDEGQFTARNVSVRGLLAQAYDVPDFQLSGGPDWIRTDTYDVNAKVDGLQNVTRMEQLRPLLRALLADRFQLKVHRTTKEMPVYVLMAGNRGHKLTVNSGKPGPQIRLNVGQLTAVKVPMSTIAVSLSRIVERPVIDKTELAGEYDFTLKWSPEPPAPGANSPQPPLPDAPPIFIAIQEQLGLKLNASTDKTEIVVIDSVEKPSPD